MSYVPFMPHTFIYFPCDFFCRGKTWIEESSLHLNMVEPNAFLALM